VALVRIPVGSGVAVAALELIVGVIELGGRVHLDCTLPSGLVASDQVVVVLRDIAHAPLHFLEGDVRVRHAYIFTRRTPSIIRSSLRLHLETGERKRGFVGEVFEGGGSGVLGETMESLLLMDQVLRKLLLDCSF
jgi:hypothetical protein